MNAKSSVSLPQRAPREQQAGIRLEVWVGLSEILARRFTEAARRYLWMSDSSATGFGFDALESDAVGIEVGDLIGWRKGIGSAIVLGQVMRRMPSSTSGQVFVGVRMLSEWAIPLPLTQVVTFDNGQADGTYLFVPGDDESGRHDAFLVSERTFELQASYNARVGSEAFTLKLNRVRARGRGWILAGFEIVPAKAADAAIADVSFDLNFVLEPVEKKEIDDEAVANAWDRELSPRLLA